MKTEIDMWIESPLIKVWERMVQRLDNSKMVIDLGCGVGQCAQFMFIGCRVSQYFGIDFSETAIAKAKQLEFGPMYHFRQDDLLEWVRLQDSETYNYYPDFPFQFFCSETLGHIEKDTELLTLLADKFPGSRIAISVPTFDDPGHVRHFKSPAEVKARYSPYIDCEDLSQIGPWIVLQGRLTLN